MESTINNFNIGANVYRQPEALSLEYLQRYVPSVFAVEPWHGMSNKYEFVPTNHIIEGMRREGFVPVKATQSRSRIPGKQAFTKHMIRFRYMGDVKDWKVGDVAPQLVLVNSHDGTSSYQLTAGLYRYVCSNGLMVADSVVNDCRVRHSGNVRDEVINASYRIVEDFPAIQEKVQTYREHSLTMDQQTAFAKAALGLRWSEEDGQPIDPQRLLTTRRIEDRADSSIWNTYNVVQENLMKGGLSGRNARGRRQRTRGVKSVDADVKLNKALWVLAEEMAKLTA